MMQTIDYDLLTVNTESLAVQFAEAAPYPHIVIDNFLSPEFVTRLNNNFPDFERKQKTGSVHVPVILDDGSEAQFGKEWMSREQLVPLIYRRLYWELNSTPFVALLEKISGVSGLLADPHLRGGGVHQVNPGGYLKVHADFNKHPNFGFDRRINLLIYLNEDWKPEYGGDLELWSTDMQRCVQRIAPLAGRCVIFRTTSTSFHGHPHPLTCPADRRRRSIALYYYSNGRPEGESDIEHGTLWQETPTN